MAALDLEGTGKQVQPVTPAGDTPYDDALDAQRVVLVSKRRADPDTDTPAVSDRDAGRLLAELLEAQRETNRLLEALRPRLRYGDEYVGRVGGEQWTCEAAPSVDTGAYASGDLIGKGPLIFRDAVRVPGGSGILHTVTLMDLAKQDAAIDLVFFSGNLPRTTFTDNAAWDVDDGDLRRYLGKVKLTSSNYVDFSDSSAASAEAVGLAFTLPPGTRDLYCVLVSRGSPTYAAATDLLVTVTILGN